MRMAEASLARTKVSTGQRQLARNRVRRGSCGVPPLQHRTARRADALVPAVGADALAIEPSKVTPADEQRLDAVHAVAAGATG